MLNLRKAYPRPLSGLASLLRYLDEKGENGYYISLVFRDVEQDLGISHSTLKRYLRALYDAEAIKYNLTFGVVMLNPAVFVYPGTAPSALTLWRAQYRNFSSVVA